MHTQRTMRYKYGSAAIIIVRNPFHALISEYSRRESGDIYSESSHTDSLRENKFGMYRMHAIMNIAITSIYYTI